MKNPKRLRGLKPWSKNRIQHPAAPAAGTQLPPHQPAQPPRPQRQRPEKIGIEDFAKVEMRVGQVKTAERVAGADKLLKLHVDIGDEVRQICAGIANSTSRKTSSAAKSPWSSNLAPRKLRGVESNGMIVAASSAPKAARPCRISGRRRVGARLK